MLPASARNLTQAAAIVNQKVYPRACGGTA